LKLGTFPTLSKLKVIIKVEKKLNFLFIFHFIHHDIIATFYVSNVFSLKLRTFVVVHVIIGLINKNHYELLVVNGDRFEDIQVHSFSIEFYSI